MKAITWLALWAGSALASKQYGNDGGYEVETIATFATVTACPYTETITAKGSTYGITQLTTPILTVTKKDTVTVPGPTDVVGTTTRVSLTYTTTCPVTETVTAPGTTYTHIYETTLVDISHVLTTLYETVTAPAQTVVRGETVVLTETSLCPVTETKTLNGVPLLVTWTSTHFLTKTLHPTTDVWVTATQAPVAQATTHVVTDVAPVTTTNTGYAQATGAVPPPSLSSAAAPVQVGGAQALSGPPCSGLFALAVSGLVTLLALP